MAEKALEELPENLRIKQLFGLCLAKLGMTTQAQAHFEVLYDAYRKDDESAGLLGRVYKDRFRQSGNLDYARLSQEVYLRSFIESQSFYTGINAATMSLIVGEASNSRSLAKQVIEAINPNRPDFWSLVTLGEAYLLLADSEHDIKYYRKGSERSGSTFGQTNSVYGQLLLLSPYLKVPPELLKLFEPPQIVTFAGHMIDHPEREFPRFPANIERKVKKEIDMKLEELNAKIGFCSLACGSDILFAESILKRGGEVNVFLPFNQKDFIETSLAFAGERWIKKFHELIKQSSVKFVTEEQYLGTDELFTYLAKVIVGNSILRSKLMQTQPSFLGVLDGGGRGRGKAGGTLEIYRQWPFKDRRHIIDPSRFTNGSSAPRSKRHQQATSLTAGSNAMIKRKVRYIMFADIVGFTKMLEEQTPYFMHVLLRAIHKKVSSLKTQPEILNTWGDAFFAVFTSASEIMDFAILLHNLVTRTNWKKHNFPAKTNVRIALHAGPVFIGTDPLTGRKNAYGTHINRAARMEPITQPGSIYASEQFAASLIMESQDRFNYEHVGIIKLPKDFGVQEIYQISE